MGDKHGEIDMISRIDHISFAVKDYEKAFHFFHHILGAVPGTEGEESDLKFYFCGFSLGDLTRIEIIKPSEKGSFLEKFLMDKKDGGIHHITLEVPDIREVRKMLEDRDVPYFGYNEDRSDWKELFIHPRDAFGVLIQIAEFEPDDYLDESMKFPEGKKWSIKKNEKGAVFDFAHPGGGKVQIELTKEEIKKLKSDIHNLAMA